MPGRTNNPAGGSGVIYLPLIEADALKTVSAITETKITFAASVLATNPALAAMRANPLMAQAKFLEAHRRFLAGILGKDLWVNADPADDLSGGALLNLALEAIGPEGPGGLGITAEERAASRCPAPARGSRPFLAARVSPTWLRARAWVVSAGAQIVLRPRIAAVG